MRFELPIISAVSALLVLIPLPWHWRTRNICTTSVILWLAACNILRTFNTIVWMDNAAIKYKVWCDIVARVAISANIGVPAATVCICRRLAHASAPYYRAPTSIEKRRRTRFEIGMCIVLPIILSGLHVLVEPCRFGIGERFGCSTCYYPCVLNLFISQIPPIVLSWAALVYSGVTLRWLIHRRVQFRQASQDKHSIPASSRYLRLVALAVSQMTFGSVISLFLMMSTLQSGIHPWNSWQEIHENWEEILVEPKGSMPENYWAIIVVTWYFVPVASVTVFAYFGLDDRVVAEYKHTFAWIKTHILGLGAEKGTVLPLSSESTIPGQTRLDTHIIVIRGGEGDCASSCNPSSFE